MNQFVKTPVTLNEAGGTRMLTDEELDEVSGGGVTLVELAVLLTVAAVAGGPDFTRAVRRYFQLAW